MLNAIFTIYEQMTSAKKPAKLKQLKAELSKELVFMKNILSAMPVQKRGKNLIFVENNILL